MLTLFVVLKKVYVNPFCCLRNIKMLASLTFNIHNLLNVIFEYFGLSDLRSNKRKSSIYCIHMWDADRNPKINGKNLGTLLPSSSKGTVSRDL